jgi:DNA-binding transcriptional MerR regulator
MDSPTGWAYRVALNIVRRRARRAGEIVNFCNRSNARPRLDSLVGRGFSLGSVMFRIGEFARIGEVSVASLRHYHERGLLVPATIDPATGYRSYSAAQLTRLSRIVALKELGFTLDQIEHVITHVTASELRGMLMLRRAQLEADLVVQQDRLARVEARLRTIEREGRMPDYEIVVKPLSAVHAAVLGGRPDGWKSDSLRAVLEPAYAQLVAILADHNVEIVGPPFDFYEGDPEEGDFIAYAAVPIAETVRELPPPAAEADLPPVEEALSVIVADVRLETFGQVYADFARWADDHDCELIGAPREGLVTMERPADDRDTVLELQQPIRRRGAAEPSVTPLFSA